jgi:hypothetical protein
VYLKVWLILGNGTNQIKVFRTSVISFNIVSFILPIQAVASLYHFVFARNHAS